MKNIQRFTALLTLLALLLALAACTFAGNDDTQPPTEPQQTTAPTEATSPPEREETEPEETEPAETEPQIQTLEPDGTPMTAQQLQRLHWQLAEDSEGWYESLLAIPFDDPRELMVGYTFGNGIPNEPRVPGNDHLSLWELDFVTEATGYDISNRSVTKIPRETVERVLLTYLELTPEDLKEMEYLSSLIYQEDTDCYYIVQNSYNYIVPYFREGYTMPDGTIVIYYCDVLETPDFRRAVLRQTEDGIYKILEITQSIH